MRGSVILVAVAMIVIGLGLGGCATSRGPSGPTTDSSKEQRTLEEVLRSVRDEYDVPALAAGFVRDGDIVTVAAVGLQRIDRSASVDIKDRFHIGSVSKPISATVIAVLVEDNVLGWETTIAEAYPDLAGRIHPAYLGITLEQLLSHRAGIVPWEEDEEIALAPAVTGSPQQQRRAAVFWLLSQSPVAHPGTEYVYSNAGYLVAAAIAEAATGLAWEEIVRERLAIPLDLTSLGFGWPARDDPAQPWGHRSSSDGFVPHDPSDSYQAGPLLGPAGDLQMSITDLARFARLHLEGLQGRAGFLSLATYQKLHRPIGDYALGWNVRETADHHLGGMGTFLAAIWVSVPRNVAIVVVTNADAEEGIVSAVINGSLRAFNVPTP